MTLRLGVVGVGHLEASPVPEVREMARCLRRAMKGRMGRAREAMRRS